MYEDNHTRRSALVGSPPSSAFAASGFAPFFVIVRPIYSPLASLA
jgi:hypothetical protein